ncbi:hypothetical protein [Pseudomonas sp. Y24-6]|uniref:DUF7673 family protein n=1 Tax=Pseudomonas sp. Y24-6 TaxID=2750013 RepID=UPI001CE067B2|nr:hypothetical protein [Pseudomonas sp. Y24-6]MCA4963785.1 hypothetical protein [Pseudomonas sp. Y24-6]
MTITLDDTTRDALDKLLVVAGTDTGQARLVANFLLAWHNAGENGGFDLTDLWGLDDALVSACAVVFLWVAGNKAYPEDLGLGYEGQFHDIWRAWRAPR